VASRFAARLADRRAGCATQVIQSFGTPL